MDTRRGTRILHVQRCIAKIAQVFVDFALRHKLINVFLFDRFDRDFDTSAPH